MTVQVLACVLLFFLRYRRRIFRSRRVHTLAMPQGRLAGNSTFHAGAAALSYRRTSTQALHSSL